MPGAPNFKCDPCQGYHVLQSPALWGQKRFGIFAIFNLNSNHRSLFGPMQIIDLPSKSIVALLEPVRKLSPAYEVNPQYSPNVSGKSKIKKSSANNIQSWQGNASGNDPCCISANEQTQRPCMSHIAPRTWRGSSKGGENVLGSPRPVNARKRFLLGTNLAFVLCCLRYSVQSTG